MFRPTSVCIAFEHKHSLCLDSDRALTLAHNTSPVFPECPEKQDLRDINGIRKTYTASLIPMGDLIDVLRDSGGKL